MRAAAFAATVCLFSAFTATAQPPTPASPSQPAIAPEYRWTPIVRNWTRVEMWEYFEPRPEGGDPDYATFANRFLAGIRHTGPRHDATVAIQYVQFAGLPESSIGPGPLGTGATYYDHNRRTDSRQVYLRLANVQVKRVLPGLDLRGGRMAYASGSEIVSGDAPTEALKRLRLDSRLIGEFEWSIYQRTYDGIRADWNGGRAFQASGSVLWPTQGGFEERAGHSLESVRVITAVAGARPSKPAGRPELQGFFYHYRDTRPITTRPDNTGLPTAAADISISAFGGSAVGVYPTAAGRVDVLGWLAAQTGDWYEQSHGAFAFALEAGHQWPQVHWQPWVRGGWNRASGDDDAADDEHGTFFPILPTGRKYSLSATYATMNMDDLFAQVLLRPVPSLGLRIDVHRLRLAEAADRWYVGSGATRRTGSIFGYAGRQSGGQRSFGTVLEGSADWTVHRQWSINGYLGWIAGGDVVRTSFAGDRLTFAYFENVIQF